MNSPQLAQTATQNKLLILVKTHIFRIPEVAQLQKTPFTCSLSFF